MESIKDRVAIVGMGISKFGENWDKSADDQAVDAMLEALEDSGLEMKDIQAAWQATLFTGETGSYLQRWLKMEYVPTTRVENYCSGGIDCCFRCHINSPVRGVTIEYNKLPNVSNGRDWGY